MDASRSTASVLSEADLVPPRCKQVLLWERTKSEVIDIEVSGQLEASALIEMDIVHLARLESRLRPFSLRLRHVAQRDLTTLH